MKIIDGIGSTEMMHIFIGAPQESVRAGSTGKAVPGYEAKVIDDEGRECAPGIGRLLAVRGPDRLPLSRRYAPERNTCRTAGTSPATPT